MNDRIKLMVTIIHRGGGTKVVDYYRSLKLHYDFLCLGHGTANSEILDYLGLEKTDKDIVITMVPEVKVRKVLSGVSEKFGFLSPGKGIVFTVPLSSVSARIPQILCKPENMIESGDDIMENNQQGDLILAVLNRGNADLVMEAAKKAGARGGTIIHARRVGFEDVENFFGFTIQPEKDIIAILTESSSRRKIMEAITQAAGISTECRALVLSIPVDEIMGLQFYQGVKE